MVTTIFNAISATGAEAAPTDAEHANSELIREFRSVPMSQRRRFLAPNCIRHRSGLHGFEALTGMATGYDEHSIADRVDHIEDMIAKGDRVWALWTVTGTHTGTIFGVPATGKPIEMLELGLWRIEDGRIVEMWFMADELALCRQIGVDIALSPSTRGADDD
jgi:predicted ester cyclase